MYGATDISSAELLHARETTLRKGTADGAMKMELATTMGKRIWPRVNTEQVDKAVSECLGDEDEKIRRLQRQKEEGEAAALAEKRAADEIKALLEQETDEIQLLSESMVVMEAKGNRSIFDISDDDEGGGKLDIASKNRKPVRAKAAPTASTNLLGAKIEQRMKQDGGALESGRIRRHAVWLGSLPARAHLSCFVFWVPISKTVPVLAQRLLIRELAVLAE
jgi:hypothetical protein